MGDSKSRWDRIYADTQSELPPPCFVLDECRYLLPASGTAIDIAAGRGANALLLAQCGLQTTALDISPNATALIEKMAQQHQVAIETIAEPVETSLQQSGIRYDVIVVSRFLDRSLLQQLPAMLNDGGLLYYQTFVKDKADQNTGPSNPEYLLDSNELLNLCSELTVRVFMDLGGTGDCQHGLRNESCLVAQKRTNP